MLFFIVIWDWFLESHTVLDPQKFTWRHRDLSNILYIELYFDFTRSDSLTKTGIVLIFDMLVLLNNFSWKILTIQLVEACGVSLKQIKTNWWLKNIILLKSRWNWQIWFQLPNYLEIILVVQSTLPGKLWVFGIWHSLRLNAEVVARSWHILGSLVVGVKILLHVPIFFWCAL